MWRVALFIGLIALGLIGSASANHWLGLKWSGSQSQSLTIYDYTTSPLVVQAVAEAAASWSTSPVVGMTITRPGGACNPFNQRAISVCETIQCSGSTNLAHKPNGIHIERVSIVIGTCGGQAEYPFILWEACHELGHSLGLDHNLAELDTCMSNTVHGYPNAHDYELLEALY